MELNIRPLSVALLLVFYFSFFIISSLSYADSSLVQIPVVDIPKGTVALGFGLRSPDTPYQDLDRGDLKGAENMRDFVPLYLYEGEYFFAHGASAGVHIFEKNNIKIDLYSRYRFDRLEPEDNPLYEGVDPRRQSVDGGFNITISNDWGDVSATVVHDMLNRHQGSEVDLGYRYNWKSGRWLFSPFVSYVYQSSALVNYYYGVSETEARDDLPQYQADESQFYRLGLGASYNINRNSVVFTNLLFEDLDNSKTGSPMVDKSYLASAFVGFTYKFGNTLQSDQFRGDPNREKEWSWRVNYGYTTEKTFSKVHKGEIEKNKDVDTNLAGLTLGKLIQNGKKIDYWGRFSLNRRLEDGIQDDFWEYNAYVMAMGSGYSPWTKREVFRYGFGFGFSYAEEVPVAEVISQGDEKNTARFLNYLEIQLDFPVRNFFEAKALKDCYIGMDVVHRSGIFGSSDILGNVNGGSNVLAGHLECKR